MTAGPGWERGAAVVELLAGFLVLVVPLVYVLVVVADVQRALLATSSAAREVGRVYVTGSSRADAERRAAVAYREVLANYGLRAGDPRAALRLGVGCRPGSGRAACVGGVRAGRGGAGGGDLPGAGGAAAVRGCGGGAECHGGGRRSIRGWTASGGWSGEAGPGGVRPGESGGPPVGRGPRGCSGESGAGWAGAGAAGWVGGAGAAGAGAGVGHLQLVPRASGVGEPGGWGGGGGRR